mmetsp:Transcript_11009/g.16459  ORF Transcript_11009/g.16459 Transcript_11009/m.16459 type:complete len:387 (+) Transcript_11009:62-1222(+)
MLTAALATIFSGSVDAMNALKAQKSRDVSTRPDEVHVLTSKDVYKSPLWGSFVLFSLYLIFKFCPKDYINIIVKGYFGVFGTVCTNEQVHEYFVNAYWMPKWMKKSIIHFKIPLRKLPKYVWPYIGGEEKVMQESDGEDSDEEVNVFETDGPGDGGNRVNAQLEQKSEEKTQYNVLVPPSDLEVLVCGLDIAGYLFGMGIAFWYLSTGSWAANNFLGVLFSLQAIRSISIGSYQNGAILLTGLFLYDIFWVFGTDVMVTVAKKFDAPIKLLFPWWVQDSESGKWKNSMLGLGDIVIPGIFIALMLRFDLKRAGAKEGRYPYFLVVMTAYAIGLCLTIFIMYTFNAAQPALLYLSPACIGSTMLFAAISGEFSELWNYNEDEKIKSS